MTLDEARILLSGYADGLLEPTAAKEVEAVLAESPELQAELKEMKEDNLLLSEALAPLRPSRSARMRLTDAMQEIHRQAEHVANKMPERGWMLFRLCFAFAATGGALAAYLLFPPVMTIQDENYTLLFGTIGIFVIGVFFVLASSMLARAESAVVEMASRRKAPASRLETLMLEVFGILAVLTAAGIYAFLLR